MERWEEAESQLLEAFEKDAKSADTLANLATVSLHLGKPASRYVKCAPPPPPSPRIRGPSPCKCSCTRNSSSTAEYCIPKCTRSSLYELPGVGLHMAMAIAGREAPSTRGAPCIILTSLRFSDCMHDNIVHASSMYLQRSAAAC